MSKHDDDDMNLTEEELAALQDGAEDDVIDDEDGIEDWVEPESQEGDNTDNGDNTDTAASASADAAATTEDTVSALEAVYASVADVKLPEGFDERVDAAQKKLDEIERQFDEGDLTTAEYKAALKEAQKEVFEIEKIKTVAENNLAIREKVGQQLWGAQVNTFFGKEENAWYNENEVAFNAMDAEVRKIATENPKMNGNEILRLANEKIAKAFGRQASAKPDNKQPTSPKQPSATPKAEKSKVPPTLGNLPAAELQTAGDGGKFAWLDRLADSDPIRYEAEIAKLSPAESAAYLR